MKRIKTRSHKSIFDDKIFFVRFFLATFLIISFFGLPVSIFVSRAYAAVGINKQINFQGKLVNSNGTNVTDGGYSVVFSLYNVASGGSAIWTETDTVTTTTGIFQVALGATTAFPGNVDFNSDSLYLGIKVGTDAEMTPRIRFAAVPYAFNAAALDDVVATQSATGFSMQGGTGTSSVLSFTTLGSSLTFQPGVAEGLTIQSNGANGLSLDTGGSGAVSIGNNNATSISFGKSSNNTSVTFNNGTGGFLVNGSGSVTFSALNAALGLVYTSGTNGILSQTAPTGGSQCLQSNAADNGLLWISCGSAGTNYWQLNGPVLSPGNLTTDITFGGSATTSAKIAFLGLDTFSPVASIAANPASGATTGLVLSSAGSIQGLNMNSLTLGGATTGSIQFYNANNTITSSGNLTLAGTTGITLSGNGAGFNFTGTATDTITTNNQIFAIMPGTGQVGINVSSGLLSSLDIRGNSGTISIASISGTTAFAGLVVNNSGVGDLFTASKSGATKFVIENDGNIGFSGTNTVLSTLASAATSAVTWTLPNATGTLCLQTSASCGFALGTNEWEQINGAISPTTITDDVLLGGTATTSARFAFINDIGAGTPTASISANSGNNATYMTGTGILATTNDQNLTLGSTTTGNVVINPGGGVAELTAYNNGTVGIGTATSTLATLDVRASSGTTAIASIAGSTAFAGMVINNSGSGDLFTASSAGATKFTIKNSGSVVFGGNDTTISASGSGAVNNGSGSVENDLGDEGSLVPNAGFEAFNNLGGFADGWVASSTNSATVSRDTTTEAKGNASAKITTAGTNQVAAFYSACMPLALTNNSGTAIGAYNLNYYARSNSTTILPTVRAYVDGYTSEVNCNQNKAAAPSNPVNTTALAANTNWNQISGSATVSFTAASTNLTWGRVHFFIANAATGAQVNIDGVRLIEDAATNGVDYAENYPADPNNIAQPGQVISLIASGSSAFVTPSTLYMDPSVMGVVSTNPGDVLDDGTITGPKVTVALAGRVPVNVSTVNGPITVGDYLTSSNIPGVAVKATGAGQVIGTAMEDDSDANTSDVTQVTMFIKNTYYNGGSSSVSGLDLLSGAQDPSVVLAMLQDATEASNSALTSLTAGQITAGLNYLVSVVTAATQSATITQSAIPPEINSVLGTATLSGLMVNGQATVSADLRVQGNALFEGILHVVDTLFANNFIANGASDFFGNVIFHNNVTFQNTPTFNGDTAGLAVIIKGSDHVDVTFSKPYDQTPIINATLTVSPLTPTPNETIKEQQTRETDLETALLNGSIHYIITNRTANGFTILLRKPAQEDISFSWIALEVSNPVIFQSSEGNFQLPSPTDAISPSPIDTDIPTTSVSATPIPTEGITPSPTPGG